MSSTVSEKIRFYGLFMTLLMVIYHLQGILGNLGPADLAVLSAFKRHFQVVGTLGMAHFFIISGFLLYYHADDANVKSKLKRRVKSLLVPFLLWNAITALRQFVTDGGVFPAQSLKELLLGFSFNPFDGPLWYVFWLLILMLAAPLLVKRKKTVAAIAVVSFVISAFNLYPASLQDWVGFYWIRRAVFYLPCYFGGAFLALHCPDVIAKEQYDAQKIRWIACAVLAGLIVLTAVVQLDRFSSSVVLVLTPVAAWLAVPAKYFSFPMGLPFRISFFIYATHGSVFMPILNRLVLPLVSAGEATSSFTVIMINYFFVILIYLGNLAAVMIMKRIKLGWLCDLLSGGRV